MRASATHKRPGGACLKIPLTMQYLISTPPAALPIIPQLGEFNTPAWFFASDPPGERLGSGGGSVHLLLSAWQRTAPEQDLRDWLQESRKLMIHGGGQSRRLPAYAPSGKLFAPMPVWRWTSGQAIDQTLLDLQRPYLERIFAKAHETSRLMIASGDVLVKFSQPLPQLPKADVVCIGLWGKPEDAQHFGVFFCDRNEPNRLAFFKQKPSPEEIQRLAKNKFFLLDAGIWLLSERAIEALLELGECDTKKHCDANHSSAAFELYSDFGLALGNAPEERHAKLNSLTTAVVSLDDGEFYHFGCNSDLIESSLRLQNLVLNQNQQRFIGIKRHPDLFVQNACIDLQWTAENHRIWVENSHIGADWCLATDHVLTGIPRNNWRLKLHPGCCLDIVPIDGDGRFAFRMYGMDDSFRGRIDDIDTRWLGRPVLEWFQQHGISLEQAGIDGQMDIQRVQLFPMLDVKSVDHDFLQWLLTPVPSETDNAKFAKIYCEAHRFSAQNLGDQADLHTLQRQRQAFQNANLHALAVNYTNSVFYRTDLARMAKLHVENELDLPPPVPADDPDLMMVVHDRMFRAETLRHRNIDTWRELEDEAFALLRKAVLDPLRDQPVRPCSNVAPDQIVWARCPVRLDIAGGWTDTPPYCQIYGGRVVNLAVNLNGQPPLQAFVRRSTSPHIILRSIDLGSQTTVTTYDDIKNCTVVGNEFSIAKAALAIAGFHPEFNGGIYDTLEKQLKNIGSGIEISFVAAVPKGSGLGTSSILGATILGALADFCGLEWDAHRVGERTLAMEQMLTSGGGWQDQFGAVLHGIKMLQTTPGVIQSPSVKWLPEHMLTDAFRDGRILLFYTGITRIAKNILQDIVRGMFLNKKKHLALLDELGCHAQITYDVMQNADWSGFCQAIDRSWMLNQQLDNGTNPREIQAILNRIQDWTAGAKLLGAGGGGYLMICAKDTAAATRIQQELTDAPPNPRARFVTPEISTTGLQVTRS